MRVSIVVLSHSLECPVPFPRVSCPIPSSVLSHSLWSVLVRSDETSMTLTPSRLVLVTHLVRSDETSMPLASSRLVHTAPRSGGYGGGPQWTAVTRLNDIADVEHTSTDVARPSAMTRRPTPYPISTPCRRQRYGLAIGPQPALTSSSSSWRHRVGCASVVVGPSRSQLARDAETTMGHAPPSRVVGAPPPRLFSLISGRPSCSSLSSTIDDLVFVVVVVVVVVALIDGRVNGLCRCRRCRR